MKFTCVKENLVNALSLVSPLASKNLNLPILSNVLIKADDQKVEIISTNLELAMVVTIRAKVDENGSFTVPAKTLFDYVHLISDEKAEFEVVNNELVVSAGKSSTKIKGMPADEFPVVPSLGEGAGFSALAEDLKKALGQVNVAAARNDIRPELSGVFFNLNSSESKMTLAATDSYRLAEKKIKISQCKEDKKAIVPGRTALELARVLSAENEMSDGEKNVRVILGENQIAATYNNVQLVSRLVEGQYPDYTQIIPTNHKTEINFSVSVITKEIKAASLFTTAGVNAVLLENEKDGNEISVSSTSTQTGEYNSKPEAEVKGEKNAILLNHRYLLDGLNSLNGDVGTLRLTNGDNPCLLRAKADESLLYIIMPIRQ